MYKNDSLYQVLLKYDFDLFRGNKGITEYMKAHLKQYYRDIFSASNDENPFLGEGFVTLLKENLPLLDEICKKIPEILEIYDQGFLGQAYQESCVLFEKMKPYYIVRFSWSGDTGCLYRIRQGDFRIKNGLESKKQKMELFHIKKEMRSRIGAYRYSVAGYPCLYLASNEELAWYECGMPKKFSYCQMLLDEDINNALKLIDLSNRPVDFLSSVNIWLKISRKRGKKEEQKTYMNILRYIVTYPLVAACSVKVKDRDSKFVEEYIFPQLFMQWIRENDTVDGVRYKSSLNTNLVQYMGAINIALPVKKFREDGLDVNLTEKLRISDIGYLDVNEDFKKYKNNLNDIEKFKNDLRSYALGATYCGDYIIELIDACECVVKTYNALIDGNYINSELIFNQLNLICDYISLLYQNRNTKIQDCINRAYSEEQKYIDKEKMEEHFEKFYELMMKVIHKHAVFNFGFESLSNFEKI